jgi:hypothetical protein
MHQHVGAYPRPALRLECNKIHVTVDPYRPSTWARVAVASFLDGLRRPVNPNAAEWKWCRP